MSVCLLETSAPNFMAATVELSNRARAIIIELALCCSCYQGPRLQQQQQQQHEQAQPQPQLPQEQLQHKKLETAAAKCSNQFAYGLNVKMIYLHKYIHIQAYI